MCMQLSPDYNALAFVLTYPSGRHRDLGVEERLDDLQGKIRELEKQNTTLKSKVRIDIQCICDCTILYFSSDTYVQCSPQAL